MTTEQIVTLALEENARVGKEFVHDKVPSECRSCKLFQICMGNLKKGREYKIVKIKENISHQCPLYKKQLLVVKVKEKPLIVAFPIRKSFPGMLIKFHPTPCSERKCKYYENCNPARNVIPMGMPVKTLKILCNIKEECKYGHNLSLVQVSKKRK
ncbi:hypothetical protein GF325_03835 [Candidatus Bathyarchaeota archaeon]|nr:hypothetical protein [Candidatus Bathyarchaeota archaeon]